MRFSILILLFSLFTLGVEAGTPVQNIVAGLDVNTNTIRVGQEVVFSFGGQDNCDEGFALVYDFGADATPTQDVEVVPMNSSPSQMIPVVFNTEGMVDVTLDLSQTNCPNSGFPFILPIEVLPAQAIPTLSQWAVLILGSILLIIGVVQLRARRFLVEKKLNES